MLLKKLGIIRVRDNGRHRDPKSKLIASVKEPAYLEEIELPFYHNEPASKFIDSLKTAAELSLSEWLIVASDDFELDTVAIIKLLEKTTTEFVRLSECDPTENILPEFAPQRVFGIVAFRKTFLLNMATEFVKNQPDKINIEKIILDLRKAESSTNQYEFLKIIPRALPSEIFDLGVAAINDHKFEEAIKLLNEVKGRRYNQEKLDFYRATAYWGAERRLEASLILAGYLKNNPDDTEAVKLNLQLGSLSSEIRYEGVRRAIADIDGYLSLGQDEILFAMANSIPKDGTIIEIGSFLGKSTISMALACVGTSRHIYAIDTFGGNLGIMGRSEDIFDVFSYHISLFNLSSYITPLRGYSSEVIKNWNPKHQIHASFIDGSHEYKDVAIDFENIYNLSVPEAWIALHDVEPGWAGSWRAWRELAMPVLKSHQYVGSLACGQKKESGTLVKPNPYNYSFSMDLISFLAESRQDERLISALLISWQREGDLVAAEQVIQQMPKELGQHLKWMSVREGSEDNYIHYWYGLYLIGQGQFDEAQIAFSKGCISPATFQLKKTTSASI